MIIKKVHIRTFGKGWRSKQRERYLETLSRSSNNYCYILFLITTRHSQMDKQKERILKMAMELVIFKKTLIGTTSNLYKICTAFVQKILYLPR